MKKRQKEMGSFVRWANLPKNALTAIAKHLDSIPDLLCLRRVCHSWHTSLRAFSPLNRAPFARELPFPFAHNPFLKHQLLGHLSLTQTTVYSCSPTGNLHGCLLHLQETKPNTFSLLNPLTGAKLNCKNKFSMDVRDYQVSEICKSYKLRFDSYDPALIDSDKDKESLNIKKAVAISNFAADIELAVLAIEHVNCSVMVNELAGSCCAEDTIYFTDDECIADKEDPSDDGAAVYHMKDNVVRRLRDFPDTVEVFWPRWLRPNA
ncbi:hypothetical protein Ancab_003105 [Ancistrocladus abbreviatus]